MNKYTVVMELAYGTIWEIDCREQVERTVEAGDHHQAWLAASDLIEENNTDIVSVSLVEVKPYEGLDKYTLVSDDTQLMDAIVEEFGIEVLGSETTSAELDTIFFSYQYEATIQTNNEIHIMLMVTDIAEANGASIEIKEGWV